MGCVLQEDLGREFGFDLFFFDTADVEPATVEYDVEYDATVIIGAGYSAATFAIRGCVDVSAYQRSISRAAAGVH